MWTLQRLAHDLRRLGIGLGDLLFIHSSFKSLGPVMGGVATVVRALERVVGPGGLVLMPSFNLVGSRGHL
jgi:aminoglycoside 3-N-acetyltransferase